RVEAGLPLFGHELEGPAEISLGEAGYSFAVKPCAARFIGRNPYLQKNSPPRRKLVRLAGRGSKAVRPGHLILDEQNRKVGTVTSFAFVDPAKNFVALACVEAGFPASPGDVVRGLRAAVHEDGRAPEERKIVRLDVLSRFPDPAEREARQERYQRVG
ncbi:MAG: hypothetical protein V1918_08005, partial [Planctomycetota bacterium]